MAQIAKTARLSRQAVYLHFADRAALMVAIARHLDERMGLPADIQRMIDAPTGAAMLEAGVSIQARRNPSAWAVARGLDPAVAAELLWTLRSLRVWEDLVLARGWSAQQYQQQVTRLVIETLTRQP